MVRRSFLAALTFGTAAVASAAFTHVVTSDGVQLVDPPLIALYAILTLWLAHGFWLALTGFVVLCVRRATGAPVQPPPAARTEPDPDAPDPDVEGQRTAILVPVYNEDSVRVFAGIRAMLDSLDACGAGDDFDMFVLSDTRNPELWLAEEAEWAAQRAADGDRARLFYRRRTRNVGRKTGNIADFLERWGSRYEFMIVLDADSVMAGETLVEMVRRMRTAPNAALIQVPPKPTNGETLFARIQEFAADVYGPLSAAGLAYVAQNDGNFWGHNAIIRTEAFINHCRLPHLSGKPPLGGEILSHDFVEAAMLRRAGWDNWIADDLGGSYEETPPTIIDFAKRDRRWCQGNMQHGRLLLARLWHPSSRYYFGTGVMAYASSLIWLIFLLVGGLEVVRRSITEPVYFSGESPFPQWPVSVEHEAVTLLWVTLVALFLPKLLGLAMLLASPERRRRQGGVLRAALSVLLEAVYSAVLAPVMMMFHAGFVLSVLFGSAVGWGNQRRGGSGTALDEAVRAHAVHMVVGAVAMLAVWVWAPELFWWTLPVLLGLVISIPFTMLSSSTRLGLGARRLGLFLSEEEGEAPPVLARLKVLLAAAAQRAALAGSRFAAVLRDPGLSALHVGLVRAYGAEPEGAPEQRRAIEAKILERGPDALETDERLLLLQDADAVERVSRALRRQPMLPSAESRFARAARSA